MDRKNVVCLIAVVCMFSFLFHAEPVNAVSNIVLGKEYTYTVEKNKQYIVGFYLSETSEVTIETKRDYNVGTMSFIIYDENNNELVLEKNKELYKTNLVAGKYYLGYHLYNTSPVSFKVSAKKYDGLSFHKNQNFSYDSFDEALYISIPTEKEYCSVIAINDIEDYYKFEINNSGRVIINGVSDLNDKSLFEIYDEKKEHINSAKRSIQPVDDNYKYKFTYELKSGIYYIKASSVSYLGLGKYTFSVEYVDAKESFKESGLQNNDDFISASKIDLNKKYNGHLASMNKKDEDYYSFSISNTSNLIFEGESTFPLYLSIYDENKNEIYYNKGRAIDSSNDKYKYRYEIMLGKGKYYLKIYNIYFYYGAYSFGVYTNDDFIKNDDKLVISKKENISSGIRIKWDYEGFYTDFNIYRENKDKKYEKIGTVSNENSYTDKKVVNGTTYKYKIVPFSKEGEGSTSVTVEMKRLTGIGITSIARNGSELKIVFSSNSKANGYKIYYSTDSDFNSSVTKSITVKGLSGKITDLDANKKYYIRIRPYYKSGDKTYYGAYSSKKTVSVDNTGKTKKYIKMSKVTNAVASSTLVEKGYSYSADYIYDGSISTAWCEGVLGYGEGETVTLYFDGKYVVSGLNINSGYQKDKNRYNSNSRPSKINLIFSDGSTQEYSLEDLNGKQTIELKKAVETSYVTIEILSVYKGYSYKDTLISEVKLY